MFFSSFFPQMAQGQVVGHTLGIAGARKESSLSSVIEASGFLHQPVASTPAATPEQVSSLACRWVFYLVFLFPLWLL